VTLKMPAFEWVHVQLHQQKGMISLSPPTICNSAEIMMMSEPRMRSMAMLNYITEKSLSHKMKRKKNDCHQKKESSKAQAAT
ncbi:hypothetical protein ACRW6C_25090, partial [Escherichia coli]